jgi:predicted Rossmann-fold nucleotide-binding protein
VLYDKSYWQGLIDWMKNTLAERGAIKESDTDLFHVVDDSADISRIFMQYAAVSSQELPPGNYSK